MEPQIPELSVGDLLAEGLGDSHLGDRVGGHLTLEADQPSRQLFHRFAAETLPAAGAFFGDPVDNLAEERAGAHGRVDDRHLLVGEALHTAQAGTQDRVGEPNHLLHQTGRGVVRAGAFTQIAVVLLEEVLVEMNVGVGRPCSDRLPVDSVDDLHERVDSAGELGVHRLRQQLQSSAHDRVLCLQLMRNINEVAVGERYVLDTGQQQGEGDRLGVTVGEEVIGVLPIG